MGHLITTDASIGIALAPGDGLDLDQLLKNADLAMYGAKGDGRRTYRFFEAGMDATRQGAAKPGARTASGDRRRRPRSLLSAAASISRTDKISVLRGAAALAASRTRHDLAGRIHPDRRRHRPDQSARPVGAAVPPAPRPPPGRIMSASRSTSRRSSSGARRWR